MTLLTNSIDTAAFFSCNSTWLFSAYLCVPFNLHLCVNSGINWYRSCGGGTGSGFTTLLLEHLGEDYAKKTKLDFAVHTAPNISTATVEPYNSIFATHGALDYDGCCFVIDNEAMYEICDKCDWSFRVNNRIAISIVMSGLIVRFAGDYISKIRCTRISIVCRHKLYLVLPHRWDSRVI